VLDLQSVVRLEAKRLTDSVAVLGPPLQRSQDQHVESSLKHLDMIPIWFPFRHFF
jgi:hypothetical protein